MPSLADVRAVACALALLALAACGASDDPATQRARLAARGTGDIVIGAAWPWEARQNVLYGQGMELAVAEVNAAGGVLGRQLRIERADDQESVDQGRQVAQKFARNPEVVAVVGHLQSYVTVPAAAIYDLSGVVLVAATSTSPELTSKGYPRVFRTIFTDDQVGREMAAYGIGRGHREFAIYYSRDEYGRGLANAFEEEALEKGGSVVNRQSYDPDVTPTRAGAAQIVAGWSTATLDAVFIAGQDQQAGLLVAELRRQGFRPAILGSDALATPAFLQKAGAAAEGTVIAIPFHPDVPTEQARAFTRAFRSKFGTQPDVGAAQGYDAVRILAHAVSRAGSSDPEKLAVALRSLQKWPAVSGELSFDDRGNLRGMPIRHVVVRNGRFEYLSEGAGAAPPATP